MPTGIYDHYKIRGKNHWNYMDGRRSAKYCCKEPNCNNEISYENWLHGNRRCISCANKICDKQKWLGKYHTEETKRKMSLAGGGTGIPYENSEYPEEFNENLKAKIRKRDNYICQKCNITEEEHIIVYGKKLLIHHIDYSKENCDKTNLITLCKECNSRVNFNRSYWQNYFETKMREKVWH